MDGVTRILHDLEPITGNDAKSFFFLKGLT